MIDFGALSDGQRRALGELLRSHAARVYEVHRLAYVFKDTDSDPDRMHPVFVCKCNEGFDRKGFNAHMEDVYGRLT